MDGNTIGPGKAYSSIDLLFLFVGWARTGLMKGSRRAPGKRFETVPVVIWRLKMAFGEPFNVKIGLGICRGQR